MRYFLYPWKEGYLLTSMQINWLFFSLFLCPIILYHNMVYPPTPANENFSWRACIQIFIAVNYVSLVTRDQGRTRIFRRRIHNPFGRQLSFLQNSLKTLWEIFGRVSPFQILQWKWWWQFCAFNFCRFLKLLCYDNRKTQHSHIYVTYNLPFTLFPSRRIIAADIDER